MEITGSEVFWRRGCYFIQGNQSWAHNEVTFEQAPEEVDELCGCQG